MGPDAVFAESLERGRFLLQRCVACANSIFPPRVMCPICGVANPEFIEARGTGTVYSTTVVRPPASEPYNVALIDLDEGVRMLSRVEDIAPSAVRIGLRVRARVRAADAQAASPALVVFYPE